MQEKGEVCKKIIFFQKKNLRRDKNNDYLLGRKYLLFLLQDLTHTKKNNMKLLFPPYSFCRLIAWSALAPVASFAAMSRRRRMN